MRMNLNAIKKRVDALEQVMAKRCGETDLVLSDEEYAAFGLSVSPVLGTHDPEYAAIAASFLRIHDRIKHPRQVSPAEMQAAMRLTVKGDEREFAAARQRYRGLINAVFERYGFDYALEVCA